MSIHRVDNTPTNLARHCELLASCFVEGLACCGPFVGQICFLGCCMLTQHHRYCWNCTHLDVWN